MALNFLDVLNREKAEVDNRNDVNQRPKNEVLRVAFKDETTRTVMLRLLPSVSLLNADDNGSLGVKERSIFFETYDTDENGQPKKQFNTLTLPSVPDMENLTEKSVAFWRKNQMLPEGKFGFPKIRENYWLNALKVVNNKGKMDYVRDENGDPKVFAFQSTSSVYKLLLEKLTDPMADYVDNIEEALMGFGTSYPIKITATSQTDRTVDIYSSSKVLVPAVDEQDIREKLDDFASLTISTDEARPDWFEVLKARVEKGGNATPTVAGADTSDPFASMATLPQDPIAPQEAFIDPFSSAIPDKEPAPVKTEPDVSDELPVVDTASQEELDSILGDLGL